MNKIFLVIFLLFDLYLNCCNSDQELTIFVEAGREECFYERLDAGTAFELDYQVVDGGQGELDISFSLTSPEGRPVLMDYKKPDNSHRVEVPSTGSYRFCFDNSFSNFNRKTVFFALFSDEDDEKALDGIDTMDEEQYEITVAEIEDALGRVKNHIVSIRHAQEQIRAWEARDRNIGESNFSRVNSWSMIQIGVMIVVGFIQVVMVKSLFDEHSKLNQLFRSSKTRW